MIGEDGYAVYKTNSKDESQAHVQFGVSTQAQSGQGENQSGGETRAQLMKPDHIGHACLATSDIESKGDSGEVYATIPEDDYTYAYGNFPNRETNK